MAKAKSKYADASNTEIGLRMNFPRPTHAIFRLDSMREQQNRSGVEGITVELTAVQVMSSPSAIDYENKTPYAPHTPGEVVQDRMLRSNPAFGRWIKTVVMTAGGLTKEAFEEAEAEAGYAGAVIEEALSEDQPIAGRAVEIRSSVVIKEKSRGKAEEDLTGEDVYVRTDYLRQITFADLVDRLSAEEQERFFPDLADQVAEEATE